MKRKFDYLNENGECLPMEMLDYIARIGSLGVAVKISVTCRTLRMLLFVYINEERDRLSFLKGKGRLIQYTLERKSLDFLPNLLWYHNAYITGGYVTHAIVKGEWHDGDIDIVINKKNYVQFRERLLGIIYFKTLFKRITENESYAVKIGANKYVNCFDQPYEIWNIHTEKIPGFRTIQIIVFEDDKLLRNVISRFDLSCNRVYYDGRQVYLRTDREELLKRECTLLPRITFLDSRQIKRIKKYEARGFTIHVPPNVEWEMPKNEVRN